MVQKNTRKKRHLQIYIHTCVVANPVLRGLLDRKRSEGQLQSSNESEKQKQNKKQTKKREKKGIITQSTHQKKVEEGHSIERVSYGASCEPSDTLPGSQPCTQTHSIYNNPVLSGFQVVPLSAQYTIK